MRCGRIALIAFVVYFLLPFGLFPQNLKKSELDEGAKIQLNNFNDLLKRYRNEGNKIQESDYLNKIAYLFWENGSTIDAVNYFSQSVEINKEVGNQNGLQAIYTNIGTIYFDEGLYSQAINYFNLSLSINNKTGKKKNICGNLINIALSNGELGNYKEAIEVSNRALNVATELNDIRLRKTTLSMLYEYNDNLGNKEKALMYRDEYMTLEKALQKETLDQLEKKTIQAQHETEKTQQRLRKTYDTLQEVSELAKQKQQEIDTLNYKFALEEKERKIKEIERESKQRIRNIVIISIIGVLIIILLVIFINYKRNKRINKLLGEQNKEISSQRDIIESANKNITHSINYAKRIQKALLPPTSNFKSLIPESFIYFQPRDIVSGDFYWFSETKLKSVISESSLMDNERYNRQVTENVEDGIIISAIDCTGHGVPGAFMSMIGFNLMHEIISMGITEPDKILSLLNIGIRNQLKQKETDNRDGMDMSLCLINKQKNILKFSGAKNPLVYVKDGELTQIKGDYIPIGGFFKEDDEREYTKHIIEITKPTMFYLFSDGYSDQIGGELGRKFLLKKFRELLFEISDLSIDEQERTLERTFNEWIGDKYTQIDDILIIGFRLYPNK